MSPPITPPSIQSSPQSRLFLLRPTTTHLNCPTNHPALTQPYRQLNSWATIPKTRSWCAFALWNQLLGPEQGTGTCRSNSASEAGLSSRPIRLLEPDSRPPKHLRDGTKTTGRTPPLPACHLVPIPISEYHHTTSPGCWRSSSHEALTVPGLVDFGHPPS